MFIYVANKIYINYQMFWAFWPLVAGPIRRFERPKLMVSERSSSESTYNLLFHMENI